jgi:hypothetical protein
MAVEKDLKVVKKPADERKTVKKVQTDFDVKRKAVKLVVAHLRKKLPETEFIGMDHITSWISDIEKIHAQAAARDDVRYAIGPCSQLHVMSGLRLPTNRLAKL